MKKLLLPITVLVTVFLFSAPALAAGISIPVSNNVDVLEAGEFAAEDGWFSGIINVGWNGNANNEVQLTWTGNDGEVTVTPYKIDSNKQRTGALKVAIEQTDKIQHVTFTIKKINGKTLNTTVIVPAAVVTFDVLRTSINPGYYFSGIIIDMGVTVKTDAIDKDTFSAIARVTEANGDVQGPANSWDPEMSDRVLEDNWARWNILDAYVVDANGNRTDSGQYIKLDIEWGTRTEPYGTSANRYDVPATRASWYKVDGYHAYASIELIINQEKTIKGIGTLKYALKEIRHDPLFNAFDLSIEVPGGGRAPLYRPDNAGPDNLRPLIVWFHGTGERYISKEINGVTVDNPGANLVGNRVLAFADQEFQSAMGGAYVLAPQSTTSGWGSHRLDDMEALIRQVVAENYIDPDRIIVGGLSMGTGMVTPLITSETENSINFAGAMLVSGGWLSEDQAAIIAAKGIPVYLVGNASDFAAFGQVSSFNNLINAGAIAKLARYPEGPVFDGDYYYGAHDSWNYVYNNLVTDENGETIFEWLSKLSR
ncbi:MAG TPA: hypothetical protein GX505_13725 [Clostridiales bacterium]|nr:hypothetical protein [Clostridiales bacterium]